MRIRNYEGVCYSVYFSLKYQFDIVDIDEEALISTGDCLVLMFAWLYFRNRGGEAISKLKNEALRLRDVIGRYWLFVYEVLDKKDLPEGDWRNMKKAGISFIAAGI